MRKHSRACLIVLMTAAGCSVWAGEGRREISQSMMPYTITNSGSYVVTENLSATGVNGIVISADHVSLDLNGFQLSGSGSSYGIIAQNRLNLRVLNGTVRNWGIGVSLLPSSNCIVRDVLISQNASHGLEVGQASLVEDCNAFLNGGNGINVGEASVVSHCVARDNTSSGIVATGGVCTISFCVARGNAGSDGIRTGPACSIFACTTRGNGGDGIDAGLGNQISDCVGYQNDDGIRATNGAANIVNCVTFGNNAYGIRVGDGSSLSASVADNNSEGGVQASSNCFIQTVTAYQNATNGFQIIGSANRLEMNHAGLNLVGYSVTSTNNLIVRNSAATNNTEYSVIANNTYANPTNDANTAGPWANFDH